MRDDKDTDRFVGPIRALTRAVIKLAGRFGIWREC